MLALPREATSAYIEDSCSKMASARQQHHPMPSPLPHGEQPVCQQCLVWFPVALIRVQQGSPYFEDLLSCKKHPIPRDVSTKELGRSDSHCRRAVCLLTEHL